jgi:EAL domain-containing protein (putative c-di-GMP-specific phosphodiesterase class I)
MRWEHPRRGPIPPSEFIPLAESCDLIDQIGQFAMASAAEKLAAWQKALNGLPIFMSVNLSSRQIIRRDLINDLRSILNKSNFIPGTFKLELTESAVMENPEQAVFILNKVKSLGVGLSLDDFGTGHSSLSYLSRFPFDIIKVDKSFVKDANPKRDVLLRSIISMAHDMGLQVVTEGVANDKDVKQLRELNCEYVQSFMFGEPVNAETALRLVKEQNLAKV